MGDRLLVVLFEIGAVVDGSPGLGEAFQLLRVVDRDLANMLQVLEAGGVDEIDREVEVLEEEGAGLVEDRGHFVVVLLAREQNADERGLAGGGIEDYGLVGGCIVVLGGGRVECT